MPAFSVCLLAVIAFSVQYESLNAFSEPHRNTGIGDASFPQPETREAYVTLVYGSFLLGTRVLGQSLRETGTKKDLIALCTETVSDEDKAVLAADGWIIRKIAVLTKGCQAEVTTFREFSRRRMCGI